MNRFDGKFTKPAFLLSKMHCIDGASCFGEGYPIEIHSIALSLT